MMEGSSSPPDEVTTPKATSSTKNDDDHLPMWTIWTTVSYVIVMLILGLPLWWKTTAVQRVPLPYDDMAELRDHLVSSFQIKVDVNLVGFVRAMEEEEGKLRETMNGHFFGLSFNQPSASEMDALYKSSSVYDMDSHVCKLTSNSKALNVYYVGRADFLKEYGERVVMGNCRSFYYISNSSRLKVGLVLDALRRVTESSTAVVGNKKGADEELQLPLSAGYSVLLSLIVPQPEVLDAKWDIEAAVDGYVNPMLRKLSSFADFTVRSQVLYYIRLNVYPTFNSGRRTHDVPYDQLPLVINPVESRLTSFVSPNPALNFLTYTAPCDICPLQIIERDGSVLESNAFLVPQWGGIFIYNPPCPNASTTTATHNVSMDKVMSVMISQFRTLIGLPEEESESKDVLSFRGAALRDWEVDMLVRKRLRNLIFTAANTLHSLGQLLDEITNIVVTEEVGDHVENSVNSIKSAIKDATEGHLQSAQKHAIDAFKSSEIAFHHPKNLKQLYFPDDQKYAIYIPLFLPVGIPVLLSLKGLLSRLLAWKKGRS